MGVDAKHAYRFGYLKLDKWKAVRLEALVREKGKCQICFEESVFNDAHHIWYPSSVYQTEERHLVILCRGCHDFLHAMMPECKTSDEKEGIEKWLSFRNAIVQWRRSKELLFVGTEGLEEEGPRYCNPIQLRKKLKEMKSQLEMKSQPVGSPDYMALVKKSEVSKALDGIAAIIESLKRKLDGD